MDQQQKTLDHVIQIVSSVFKIDKAFILSANKSPAYATPRKVVYYILHKHLKYSAELTAELTKRKDHGTIISGCNTLVNEADTDNKLQYKIDLCVSNFYNWLHSSSNNILAIKADYQQLASLVFNCVKDVDLNTIERAKLCNNIVAKLLDYN